MRTNSRMLLVGILVFVFPLLFIWVTQNFYTTAYSNIDTSEKRRVSLLQDSLVATIENVPNYDSAITALISLYSKENPDITKIRIVDQDETGFRILYALDNGIVGTYEKSDQLYRNLPLSSADGSLIYKVVIDGVRTWQVFRRVDLKGNQLYIFTEHKFDLIDSVMAARRQQSYYGLTAIFLFLIALAYWINRQIQWEKQHYLISEQLKERDLFSNMIAHEFRSPLTAIKGYASFLEESKSLTKDEVRFANNIKGAAERLVVLVSDFLEVARIQSGKLKIKHEQIDLRDTLSKVVENLQIMADDKGLQVLYQRGKKPILMETDPDRLMQVLTNIVSNAVKYTNKGAVELECAQMPGEITIRVKDTGMGISAEDQKKLFAPFTRVGGVDSGSIEGTGLGMWVTKQLVALLVGTIGVESIKGVGTHIVITFRT